MIVGAAVPAGQNVTLNRIGFDGTYFEVTVSGGATSSVIGRSNVFPINSTGTASRTVVVGLDTSTATAGLRSNAVTINNLEVTAEGRVGRGANDSDDVITASIAVLAQATPSFLADRTGSILTLDFGTLVQGDPASILPFDIFKLVGGLGSRWTAVWLAAAVTVMVMVSARCRDAACNSVRPSVEPGRPPRPDVAPA